MIFNSLIFVAFFLIVYPLYLGLTRRAQNVLLLLASYFFYGWWDWRFLLLLAFTTVVDYTAGRKIESAHGAVARKRWLLLSISTNLGVLGFFKYFDFFAANAYRAANVFGLDVDPVLLHVILPVGLSFYTFQSIGYTVDVYREKVPAARDLLDFSVFVSFFPQLVAGPIERARHMLPQIQARRIITYEMLREGAWLLLLGYFKKVVVADNVAPIADAVFNNLGNHPGPATWLGVYAFAIQIYCDFSGYSDIARGLAKLMGFDLMINFRMPYFAVNPQDFWQRWHISLSTWLRDYLYIPLGGNRHGEAKTYRNLGLTMFLGGLWHGAAWHFIAWGVFHGAILIVHRLFTRWRGRDRSLWFPTWLRVLAFFHVTCAGWVLFRVNHLGDMGPLFRNLVSPGNLNLAWIAAIVIYLLPLLILDFINERNGDMLRIKRLPVLARASVYGLLFFYILVCGKVDGSRFIYFQF